jgi:LacI family transcriptional regulator
MPTDKHPTIRQIAQKLGYSNGAVSMALRDHPNIPLATREKIQKAAKTMGYKVDAHFAQLMSYMRTRQTARTNCNLAWLYCGNEPRAYHRDPWSIGHLSGATSRADKLGFTIDEVWASQASLNGESLTRILLARGIQGIIIAPPWWDTAYKLVDWSLFASVMLDESSAPPFVNRVAVDYFAAMRTAMDQALRLGYKRPGYCRTEFFDMVSVGKYSGSFLYSQDRLSERNRIPLPACAPSGSSHFIDWFKTYRPDVLITSEKETIERVNALGLKVPENVGVIHLNLNPGVAGWSGIDQQHELLGSAAIEMLASQLNKSERGIPKNKREMLIEGRWIEGYTTRRQG